MRHLPQPGLFELEAAPGAVGGGEGTLCHCPPAGKVGGRICQHLRLGDDALAVPVQGWHEFSETIKPKISSALLDLASLKLSGEWLLSFLVRRTQEHGFLINLSFVVNRVQDPSRLVCHSDQGWSISVIVLWEFWA